MNSRNPKLYLSSRRKEAQAIVYDLINDDGSASSWTELRKRAKKRGMSSSTLAHHLKSLVKARLVRRDVDDTVYPPSTRYSRKAHLQQGSPKVVLAYVKVLDMIRILKVGRKTDLEALLTDENRGVLLHLQALNAMMPSLLSSAVGSSDDSKSAIRAIVDVHLIPWLYALVDACSIEGYDTVNFLDNLHQELLLKLPAE